MTKRSVFRTASCVLLLALPSSVSVRVGIGKYDATPPVTDMLMMGMANPGQVGTGLHTRLWSRAFVFVDDDGSRAAFVSVDGGMVGHVLKKRSLERCAELLNETGVYTFANTAISGTHTHSGPSGFLQHVIFQFAGSGWVKSVVDAMVEGIAVSLVEAHRDVKEQALGVLRGTLKGASMNRSPSAYLLNPLKEREEYDSDVDTDMTLLTVDGTRGVVAWFAVHPTSMNNTNTLVSSDNRGLASLLLERETRGVAAFASSNLGDVTPNIAGPPRCRDTGLPCDVNHSTCPQLVKGGKMEQRSELCSSVGPGVDIFDSTRIIAGKQLDRAKKMMLKGETEVQLAIPPKAKVRFAHTFVEMPGLEVRNDQGALLGELCEAALGDGFAAGTVDGPGQFDFTQGAKSTNPLWPILSSILHRSTPEQRACQRPKTILLPTGSLKTPHAWAPSILPFQLITIGDFVIAAVPTEMSTMAGRRLKKMLRSKFGGGGEVVIAGLSNEYADYTVTREEYQQQRYEGASTTFGPLQLESILEQYAKLADSLLLNVTLEPGPQPPDFSGECWDRTKSAEIEAAPKGRNFGDLVSESWNSTVKRGGVAIAKFVGGDLKHDLKTNASYFDVEMSNGDSWRTLYVDSDVETRVDSKKRHEGLLKTPWREIELRFDVPLDAATARYRLVYHGSALVRSFSDVKGSLVHFDGKSSEFTVV